jgi:hypothetical protein
MRADRSFIVWGVGIGVVMLPFLGFVAFGWPGDIDSCVAHAKCFCEAFDMGSIGHRGVRQPVNTWFNLYSILTSGLVALILYLDRKDGPRGENVMRSDNFIADFYVFAVLFLGLGSMWMHASLVAWAGNVDGLSMYVYAAFLVAYTLRRLVASDILFWIVYPALVVVFEVVSILWTSDEKSLVLILILVVLYLGLEIGVCIKQGKFMQGRMLPILLWSLAVLSIGLATLFWVLSQTGGAMCFPNSFFQPHGLLWHPLAGAMAVLLYFYWREEGRA